MSGPEGTEARRPLRNAGWVMLGLAAVAVLIGLAVVLIGDAQNSAGDRSATADRSPADEPAPPSSTLSPPASTTVPGSPTATSEPGPSGPGPTDSGPAGSGSVDPGSAGSGPAQPGSAQPGSAQSGSAQPGPARPGPAAAAPADTGVGVTRPTRGEARVYNNSTITGLAARAAQDLDAAGWSVVEVDNYSGGRIPTTTVYFREGTDERRIAEAIGAEFGMRVEPRFPGITHARPGVIVIVTNDYGS